MREVEELRDAFVGAPKELRIHIRVDDLLTDRREAAAGEEVDLEGEAEQTAEPQVLRALLELLDDRATHPVVQPLLRDDQGAHLAEVFPDDVQRAAADEAPLRLRDDELLNGFEERDDLFAEQDPALDPRVEKLEDAAHIGRPCGSHPEERVGGVRGCHRTTVLRRPADPHERRDSVACNPPATGLDQAGAMSIKVALEHYTSYEFARPVSVTPHVVRLRPAPHARTPIEAYTLDISPANHFLNWQQDPFGNWLARIVFPEKVSKLEITVGVVADMMVINPLDFFIEEYAERFPFTYAPSLAADLAPYLRPVEESDRTDAWRAALPPLPADGMPTVHFLSRLNSAVNGAVAYSVRMEPGVQTPDHTLAAGIGSCRDSAWMLVSLLRQYGLAARFVSGYLVQLAPDQKSLDGGSGPAEDFTDLHAWAEVFIPGAGWVGLDATSALFAGEGHIPLSATPHPSSAAPIEGGTEPVEVTFGFHNEVRRIHEDPRTTKPYTDAQWGRIDAVGELVDERLRAGDVRLTLGGEPTFVALDDATAAEWNTDADGPQKRELANVLAERLRRTYAAGGIVHRGQGKWYPGEPMPRWNIALQWRTDGVPLWNRAELFDDPWGKPAYPGSAPERAEALARSITGILGLPEGQLLPATEDALAARLADVRRPAGAPPGDEEDSHAPDAGAPPPWFPPRTPRPRPGHEFGRAPSPPRFRLVGGPRLAGRTDVPGCLGAPGPRHPPRHHRRSRRAAHHSTRRRGARRLRARFPAADRPPR